MLLAFASLGAGVSAEQNNEQATNLEDLGILELSIDDNGVIEAMVTKEVFYAFMDADEDVVPAIESISMALDLNDGGELTLSQFSMGLGEEQSDEIEVTIHLSDAILDLLESDDLDLEELITELGIEDYDEQYGDYVGTDIYWADQAYQVRGCQDDYEAVMDAEDAEEEFYRILEEFEGNYDTFANDTFGSRLHWADEAYQIRGSQEDYDRVMDAEDPADEFYTIYEEVMQEWEDVEAEEDWNETNDDDWVESGELEENESDLEGDEHWEDVSDMGDELDNYCERGLLRGVFTIDDEGNGTMRGLIMNEEGDVIGNMWGQFNTEGFAHGFGGADNLADAKWKAVYEDGRFTGLWKMVDENESMHGLLKGHYEVNETEDGGVFHGKWKEVDCHEMRDESEHPERDDVRPRHTPLQVDSDRVDVRPLNKALKQKPMMDKLGDVMDKPIIEDDEGGAIVDIGEAAAGSTLGTIALFGAGFLRRRITGGL
jgi:hypothetical protein